MDVFSAIDEDLSEEEITEVSTQPLFRRGEERLM
jgi:hypothetical protein